MTVVYISHPIKGLSESEISGLEQLGTNWVRYRDFLPLRPRSIQPGCVQVGEEPCKPDGSAGPDALHTHACFMKGDLIAMLQQADMILLMPGWEQSTGCRAELNTALAAGLSVHIFNPLNPKESL